MCIILFCKKFLKKVTFEQIPKETELKSIHTLKERGFQKEGVIRRKALKRHICHVWGTEKAGGETPFLAQTLVVKITVFQPPLFHPWAMIHSWPLNNTGLNCADPLTHGYFSKLNITVIYDPCWLNSRIWNCGFRRSTIKLY